MLVYWNNGLCSVRWSKYCQNSGFISRDFKMSFLLQFGWTHLATVHGVVVDHCEYGLSSVWGSDHFTVLQHSMNISYSMIIHVPIIDDKTETLASLIFSICKTILESLVGWQAVLLSLDTHVFMPRLTKVSGAYSFCLVRPSVRLSVRVYVPLFVDTTPPKL